MKMLDYIKGLKGRIANILLMMKLRYWLWTWLYRSSFTFSWKSSKSNRKMGGGKDKWHFYWNDTNQVTKIRKKMWEEENLEEQSWKQQKHFLKVIGTLWSIRATFLLLNNECGNWGEQKPSWSQIDSKKPPCEPCSPKSRLVSTGAEEKRTFCCETHPAFRKPSSSPQLSLWHVGNLRNHLFSDEIVRKGT